MKINHTHKSLLPLKLQMFSPAVGLEPYIQCYWSISPRKVISQEVTTKIVSDGGAGVVFNDGDPISLSMGDVNYGDLLGSFITGPTLLPVNLTLRGNIRAFGIRFHPGGLYPIIKYEMDKIVDEVLPLSSITPHWLILANLLLKCVQNSEKHLLLDDYLQTLLLNNTSESQLSMTQIISQMQAYGGRLAINDICSNYGISGRHFQRRFRREVGILPKQLSRVFRMEKSRALLRSQIPSSLADVGYECDYFDQSHFVREFLQLTGETPKNYHNRKIK